MAFNWSTAKHFRLYSFDLCLGDEWASLPLDMQHEGSPGALPAQEAEAGLHLEWMLECPECGAWNSPRLDRIAPVAPAGPPVRGKNTPYPHLPGLSCTGCGAVSWHESWAAGRYQSVSGEHVHDGLLRDAGGEPMGWPESTAIVVRGAVAPNVPWERLLGELESAGEDPAARRAVYSTVDAEVQISGESTVNESMAMRTPVEARGRPVFGVDVQDDRIEVSVCQSAGERVEVLAHVVLEGETADDGEGAWALLAGEIAERNPALAMVDSGWRTRQAYSFCRSHRNAHPVKGRDGLGGGELWRKSRREPGRGKPVDLYLLDAAALRRTWQARLLSRGRERWFAFDRSLGGDYFRQLLAEQEIAERDRRTGAYRRRWVSTGPNEAGDCLTYASAALLMAARRNLRRVQGVAGRPRWIGLHEREGAA